MMRKLRDGREVDTNSQEWRFELEARLIASMGTATERRAMLAGTEAHRGKELADRLRIEVRAIWEERKQKTGTPPAGHMADESKGEHD